MDTETVEIKKSNLKAAYQQANEETKKLLGVLFGLTEAAKDDRPVTERVKTVEDACRELGDEHPLVQQYRCWMQAAPVYDGSEYDLIAYLKLRIITSALNEGWEPQFTEDETRYYPWFWLYTQEELDKMGDEEKERRRMMLTGDYQTEFAGFGCANSDNAPSITSAHFGSRLCLRTDELATYCGRQFNQLWADFTLTRK